MCGCRQVWVFRKSNAECEKLQCYNVVDYKKISFLCSLHTHSDCEYEKFLANCCPKQSCSAVRALHWQECGSVEECENFQAWVNTHSWAEIENFRGKASDFLWTLLARVIYSVNSALLVSLWTRSCCVRRMQFPVWRSSECCAGHQMLQKNRLMLCKHARARVKDGNEKRKVWKIAEKKRIHNNFVSANTTKGFRHFLWKNFHSVVNSSCRLSWLGCDVLTSLSWQC